MTDTIDLQAILDDLGPGLAEAVTQRDAKDAFAAENYAALKARKVFSAMVPSELGGGGANVLVKQHGEDAPIEATMRADAMLEKGDLDGYAVWRRVLRAVGELQRREPVNWEKRH